MSNTATIFNAQATNYEAQRRLLVPPFDAFYDAAVDALELAHGPVRRVLDLGAGTGLLARRVLAAYPDARLTLVDGAPAMLDRARAALRDRATYVVADLADPLPAGRWDAIVSALAVHHLDDAGKRRLFARAHDALVPGGVFVNAEHVAAPTAALEAHDARWHERRARAAGAGTATWAACVDRMRQDRCATVEAQLAWLRDAGFAHVDCRFKDRRFAVLVALRG